MPSDTLKKYVGVAGDALVKAWGIFTDKTAAEPPVGSKDVYGGRAAPAAVAAGGISTGTILIALLAWFFLKKK